MGPCASLGGSFLWKEEIVSSNLTGPTIMLDDSILEVIKIGSNIWGFLEIRGSDGLWECRSKIPNDRDYDWFGLLAGVRNYVNADPIANPRGAPIDASVKIAKKIDYYGLGRTYSWLTYEDFLDYNWDSMFIDGRKSTIDRKTGEELGKARYSDRWGSEPDLYEYKNMRRVARDLITKEWEKFLNKMELLALKYGPENVRIVFWFD